MIGTVASILDCCWIWVQKGFCDLHPVFEQYNWWNLIPFGRQNKVSIIMNYVLEKEQQYLIIFFPDFDWYVNSNVLYITELMLKKIKVETGMFCSLEWIFFSTFMSRPGKYDQIKYWTVFVCTLKCTWMQQQYFSNEYWHFDENNDCIAYYTCCVRH